MFGKEPDTRPVARIVQETDGTSGRGVHCELTRPDGSTIGGLKTILHEYARKNGWRVEFVPLPKPAFKVGHGIHSLDW